MVSLLEYQKIKNDFDQEAQKVNGMFSKHLTDCDNVSIKYLNSILPRKCKILEIGCGKGNVIENIMKPGHQIEKYAIDLSWRMLSECQIENKHTGNMDELPYEDDTFDLVYMVMTLQQSKDREKTLSEMERVAKDGARLVVIDGDRDSGIGQHRERELANGTWETCGEARWLSKDDMPDWEVGHLRDHIIIFNKKVCKQL